MFDVNGYADYGTNLFSVYVDAENSVAEIAENNNENFYQELKIMPNIKTFVRGKCLQGSNLSRKLWSILKKILLVRSL